MENPKIEIDWNSMPECVKNDFFGTVLECTKRLFEDPEEVKRFEEWKRSISQRP